MTPFKNLKIYSYLALPFMLFGCSSTDTSSTQTQPLDVTQTQVNATTIQDCNFLRSKYQDVVLNRPDMFDASEDDNWQRTSIAIILENYELSFQDEIIRNKVQDFNSNDISARKYEAYTIMTQLSNYCTSQGLDSID